MLPPCSCLHLALRPKANRPNRDRFERWEFLEKPFLPEDSLCHFEVSETGSPRHHCSVPEPLAYVPLSGLSDSGNVPLQDCNGGDYDTRQARGTSLSI
jgi:hypothetical protein